MNNISQEQAVDLAVKFARESKLDEFVVAGAYLVENENFPYWRVLLHFVDNHEDMLGLPQDIGINVDKSTGRTWALKSL